jgi:hypothetical protein
MVGNAETRSGASSRIESLSIVVGQGRDVMLVVAAGALTTV